MSAKNQINNHAAKHPQIVTLTSGTTTIGDQSIANTDIIFAGTSSGSTPTLQFVGAASFLDPEADVVTYSVHSLTVAGNTLPGGLPTSGAIGFGYVTSLIVTNGVHITDGQLTVGGNYATDITYGGNSIIDDNGTLNNSENRRIADGSTLNGTITLGANGANHAYFFGEGLGGSGTIRQLGKDDVTGVDYVGPGVHLDIKAGTLDIGGVTGGFEGAIGPANGHGPSLGPTATVVFNGYGVSTGDTISAKFDTSSGKLSLFAATGLDLGDLNFSGDARGLNISIQSGSATITDHPGAGSMIPITFV